MKYDLIRYYGTLGLDSDYVRWLNMYSNTEWTFAKGILNVKYIQTFMLVKGQGQVLKLD